MSASQQSGRLMSALGQEQTSLRHLAMSALPPKADIERHDQHVRFVPKADLRICSKSAYSITSSAATSNLSGTVRPSALAEELAAGIAPLAAVSVEPSAENSREE